MLVGEGKCGQQQEARQQNAGAPLIELPEPLKLHHHLLIFCGQQCAGHEREDSSDKPGMFTLENSIGDEQKLRLGRCGLRNHFDENTVTFRAARSNSMR